MKIIRFHQDGAFSVIAVLIAVVVLSSFVAVAFSFTSSNGRMAQRSRQLAAAEGVAEGGLELLFARWRAAGRAGGFAGPCGHCST
jgi:type II secretory pathway component PulJ